MIYFMQATDGGTVKIGSSKNVADRKSQLENLYHRSLVVLATMEGSRKEEHAMHKRFDHLRIPSTEQFQPAADLMAFINHPDRASVELVEPMQPSACNIRLHLTAEERDRLRVIAAQERQTMAIWCRNVVRAAMAKAEHKGD